jgi:hypothetical protein
MYVLLEQFPPKTPLSAFEGSESTYAGRATHVSRVRIQLSAAQQEKKGRWFALDQTGNFKGEERKWKNRPCNSCRTGLKAFPSSLFPYFSLVAGGAGNHAE